MQAVRQVLGRMVDLVFPPRCRVCETESACPLCPACVARLEYITGPICHACGLPLDPGTHHGDRCAPCRDPHPLDRARSVCRYAGLTRKAIHELKYSQRTELAPPLGDLMVRCLADPPEYGPAADPYYTPPPRIPLEGITAVVPVPLSREQQRRRGFNQSERLAIELGSRLGLPVFAWMLQRIRDTPPQVRLSARERARNVRGAFQAAGRDSVADQVVLLVDDVLTTGATLNECARVLKRAGAADVYGITMARQTVLPTPEAAPASHVV